MNILEIGFGTGLNAFITFLEAKKRKVKIAYTAVEAYPILPEEVNKLNYADRLYEGALKAIFQEMHELSWEEPHHLNENFELTKKRQLIQDIDEQEKHDLIFFDAFAPQVQPELWTEEIFQRMFKSLKAKGILVTYSAKGNVRRAMQTVGFRVERVPGPPGKREMLRATKPF